MNVTWGIRPSPGHGDSDPNEDASSGSSIIVQTSNKIAVELSDPEDDAGYISFAEEEKRVRKVLKELGKDGGSLAYRVRFADNHTEEVRSFSFRLLHSKKLCFNCIQYINSLLGEGSLISRVSGPNYYPFGSSAGLC